MRPPIYMEARENPAKREGDGHCGLWFERFFNRYQHDWSLDKSAKLEWIETIAGQTGDKPAIAAAAGRLRRLCDTLGGETRAYAADWHFATGLGNPHPVESSFLWHPTLGVPYIPGAAVKGLVRAYVESWMDNEAERLSTLYRWFGSEDKNFIKRRELRDGGFIPPSGDRKIDTEAGAFIFFDALPIGPVTLKADVMTPHMGQWYAEGDRITNVDDQPERVPADWHDPVPVFFLVADKPRLQFCIAPRSDATSQELQQVFEALQFALEYLGAGAKTAAGYGRFQGDDDENGRIARARKEEAIRNMTDGERLRAEVFAMNENQLAEKLGKERTKTKTYYETHYETHGIWTHFLAKVAEVHGDMLRPWKNSSNKHQKRAYKTVFEQNSEE